MRSLLLSTAIGLAALAAQSASAQTAQDNDPRIAVPVHDIERGEVIAQSDLAIGTVPPDRIRPGLAVNMSDLVGHEARRLLRAGEAVRIQDLRMPVLVVKGSTVTMVFNAPGITLTASGRAMSDGGLGDTIAVENPVSFRQVSCVVTGRGEVRAGDDAAPSPGRMASNP